MADPPLVALSPLVLLLPLTANHTDDPVRVLGLALGFSGLIALCFALQQRGVRLRPLIALKPLGDMSYTLYLIHMPVCVFLSGWVMSRSADRHLPRTPVLLALTLLTVLPLAYFAHLLVERPFTRASTHAKGREGSPGGAPIR